MRLVLAATVVLLASPVQAGRIFLTGDPEAWNCATVVTGTNTIVDVYVVAEIESDATGARFRIPDPACPGVTLVEAIVLNGYLSLGDVSTGIDLAFGGCLTSKKIPLVRLRYQVTDTNCCEFQILAHPAASSGEPEIVDCSFMELATVGENIGFLTTGSGDCGYSPPPDNPSPPDGAINVPVSFSWPDYDIDGAHVCPKWLCYDEIYRLYFGTSSDPPLVYTYMGARPTLGPLEPSTTYYWRLVVINCGFLAESPVWSFTTENAMPAESRTWGAVKALYR